MLPKQKFGPIDALTINLSSPISINVENGLHGPPLGVPDHPEPSLFLLLSHVYLRVVPHVLHVETLPQIATRARHGDQRDLILDDVHLRIPRGRPQLQALRVRPSHVLGPELILGIFQYQPLLAEHRLLLAGVDRPDELVVALATLYHSYHLPHEPKGTLVVQRAANVDVRRGILAVQLADAIEAVRRVRQDLRAAAGVAGD
mmetsp:Transcript_23234/g.49689  ORF Transcript_23234/g.49689 Transcript_23234/m.49689 type:complete len:202 (-) Transcript_23234:383-988(-)